MRTLRISHPAADERWSAAARPRARARDADAAVPGADSTQHILPPASAGGPAQRKL